MSQLKSRLYHSCYNLELCESARRVLVDDIAITFGLWKRIPWATLETRTNETPHCLNAEPLSRDVISILNWTEFVVILCTFWYCASVVGVTSNNYNQVTSTRLWSTENIYSFKKKNRCIPATSASTAPRDRHSLPIDDVALQLSPICFGGNADVDFPHLFSNFCTITTSRTDGNGAVRLKFEPQCDTVLFMIFVLRVGGGIPADNGSPSVWASWCSTTATATSASERRAPHPPTNFWKDWKPALLDFSVFVLMTGWPPCDSTPCPKGILSWSLRSSWFVSRSPSSLESQVMNSFPIHFF